MTQLAKIVLEWKDYLDTAITYAAFMGVFWTALKIKRDNEQIAIVAVNAAAGERRHITYLPRFQVTRGEVPGTLRLEAGGEFLKTHFFRWNEKFKKKVLVLLPAESFTCLRVPAEKAS